MTLEVEPRLVALFARSFPAVTVVPLGPPLVCRAGRRAGADRRPRPPFPPELGGVSEARARLSRCRRRAYPGTAPAARRRPHGDRAVLGQQGADRRRRRRARGLPILRRCCGRRTVRFVDLQYGDTRAEREAVERELGIRVERLPDIDNTNDLDGLAALMCACDAVVTVSNTTAHLAGALGRPTLVMVPHGHARIWYWFRDRDESPWYPRVRVRRQQRGQPWSELIAAVAGELRTAACAPSTGLPHDIRRRRNAPGLSTNSRVAIRLRRGDVTALALPQSAARARVRQCASG